MGNTCCIKSEDLSHPQNKPKEQRITKNEVKIEGIMEGENNGINKNASAANTSHIVESPA